tara:strand:+ start:277 stop:738 length:462 start_codon:yes stop_codon:yes gene_type:complete
MDLSDNSENINTFSYQEKKKMVYKIEQIKNKKIYIKLFKLISNDNIKFTDNNNGIFINMNSLSNKSLHKINDFLNSYNKSNDIIATDTNNSTIDTDYKPYSIDEFSDYKTYGPKLSNFEKNIIKRNRFNDESDDQDLFFKNTPNNKINININN